MISVAELRRSLSGALDAAEAGSRVVVTRHGRPVAILSPIEGSEVASTASAAGDAHLSDGSLAHESRATYAAGVTRADEPISAPVRSDQWSDRLFASVGVRRVLSLFVLQPERVFYQREVARTAGVPLRSAQLALDRLVGLGLVDAERSGNRMHYSAVRSPAFDAFRQWAIPEVSLVPILREALEPLGDAIEMAFVYGSTAAGEDTATSDIDLMIVGEADTYEVIQALDPVRERVGREINISRYAPAEFHARLAERSHFVTTVMRSPILRVIGAEGPRHDH
ncbi:MAG: type II toxin-antitoxin system prevent-host-death family antitoxin [Coriobacteriia bacterium]|nr:type II toxin-antitoxin system prevent-host-death family antitoxin [Coriobacteriia bacterium]MDZ4166192.1 type II toxin-antitoxin system prevent-host-death family antitoxin [Coriobacteriia bacterium]